MHSEMRTVYKLCTCTCMYVVFKRRFCDINNQCRSSIYFACRRKGCLRVCAILMQSLFVFCPVSLTRSYWQSFTCSGNCSCWNEWAESWSDGASQRQVGDDDQISWVITAKHNYLSQLPCRGTLLMRLVPGNASVLSGAVSLCPSFLSTWERWYHKGPSDFFHYEKVMKSQSQLNA